MLKMTVGENLNPPVSFFCVIYDGLSGALNRLKQSNHSAFPWPCPAFCSSLIQTHSISWSSLISPRAAEAWAGKEDSGPASKKPFPFPVSQPQIDSSAAGARPKTMRGIFGAVIWGTHGIWTGHTLKRVTPSAGLRRSTIKRGAGGGVPRHPSGNTLSSTEHLCWSRQDRASAPFLPRGPGPGPPCSPVQGGGLRTHSHRSASGNYRPLYRWLGRAGSVEHAFPLRSSHLCQSHMRFVLIWVVLSHY